MRQSQLQEQLYVRTNLEATAGIFLELALKVFEVEPAIHVFGDLKSSRREIVGNTTSFVSANSKCCVIDSALGHYHTFYFMPRSRSTMCHKTVCRILCLPQARFDGHFYHLQV